MGGVLMILSALVIGPMTSNPSKDGTKHVGFSPDDARNHHGWGEENAILVAIDVCTPYGTLLLLGGPCAWCADNLRYVMP